MASKYELKTMAAIAFTWAVLKKMGVQKGFRILFKEAFSLWPKEIGAKNRSTVSGWLDQFEEKCWAGEEKNDAVHLSFCLGILEHQSEFLKGAKLRAVNDIIYVVSEFISDEMNSFEAARDGYHAKEIWRGIVNDVE